jgi:hypothetical protein
MKADARAKKDHKVCCLGKPLHGKLGKERAGMRRIPQEAVHTV